MIEEDDRIKVEEVPEPDFKMKYYEITDNLIKYMTAMSRKTFEYKELFYFYKHFLKINHSSYFKNYSMENGLSIELHHAIFTLNDITRAVAVKQLEKYGYLKTFNVTEEVARLHFEFKVGLTPLDPTSHELVHSDAIEIHPDIIIGKWEDFYGEYYNYLSERDIKNYNLAMKMLETSVKMPEMLEYKPVILETPLSNMINSEKLNELVVNSRIKLLDGENK